MWSESSVKAKFCKKKKSENELFLRDFLLAHPVETDYIKHKKIA